MEIAEHILVVPGICGGRPHIAGTGVRVQDIVADYEVQGMTPEEIARGYAKVSLARVHAALAYYYERRDEIQRHLEEDRQLDADFAAEERRQQSVSKDAGTVPS